MISALLLGFCTQAAAQPFTELVNTRALTASDERRVGELTFSLSTGLLPIVQDPQVVARTETVLRRVIRASDRPGQIVQLRILDDPTINAAAYPGGYMLVHSGAVELFTPDELAFVLAHELAHVQLRHYANGTNLNAALDQLSEVERARAGAARVEDRDKLFEVKKLLAHYGRQLEFEADLYGLLFLIRAGRPAAAAFSAMDKLEALAPGRKPHALDGHPTPTQRKADLQKGLNSLRSTHLRFEEGVAAMQAGRTEDATPAFEDFLTVFPNSVAAWINLSSSHHAKLVAASDDPWFERMPLRRNSKVRVRGRVESGRAYDAASRALALDPENPHALSILSSLARHAGHRDQSLALLARAEAAGLDATTVAVNRGVIEADTPNALHRWEAHPTDPFAIANRAVWHEQNKQPSIAIELWGHLEGTRLESAARVALKKHGVRLDPPNEAEKLGPIRPGERIDPVLASLGKPPVHRKDTLGAFYSWPEQGVSVFTFADRVERVLCAHSCTWKLKGVGLGDSAEQVRSALGNAETHILPYGGEVWFYPQHGASLHVDAAGLASMEQSARP